MSEENIENSGISVKEPQEVSKASKDDANYRSIFTDPNLAKGISLDEMKESLLKFSDVELNLKVNLGSLKMPISQFLRITRGSIIELGKEKEDLVDVFVNDKKIADAEILVESDYVSIGIQNIYRTKKY